MEACSKFYLSIYNWKTAEVPTIQVTGSPRYHQDVVVEADACNKVVVPVDIRVIWT
jgi:hypothetical protein